MHPNDEVNASQSSNDTFPTAVHLAAADAALHDLVPALEHLAATLEAASDRTGDVVKAGRTHLMDATPVTLGQELGGYAAQVRRGVERLRAAVPRVAEVPLGGTAVGTGINTPPGFAAAVIEELAGSTGLPVTEARDHFEAQGARDALVELSGAARTVAVSLTKICNDLRWMGSGPLAGLGEVHLPDLQPGSSIMPGKVNPVVPESVLQVCAQVVGHDATIAWAGASGSFELNVMVPVMSRAVLEQLRLLANGARLLADRCVAGLEPDRERALRLAQSSPSIVTPAEPGDRLRERGEGRQARGAQRPHHSRGRDRPRVRRARRDRRGDAGPAARRPLDDRRPRPQPLTADGAVPDGRERRRRDAGQRGSVPAGRLGRSAGAQYQPWDWLCAQAPQGVP